MDTKINCYDTAARTFISRTCQAQPRTLTELIDLLFFWGERARQRKSLAKLDDRMLRDIGLTRFDVAREVEKPFWQA